jgi:hypothetical protein
MTSKKIGSSPLGSLIQQWSQQPEPQPSYRILLQSTMGLPTRIQAANAVDNPHLYRRAGLRTPSESATRDLLGGPAWLQHLVQLGCKQQQQQNCHVVLIRTQTTTKESSMPSSLLSKVSIIHAAEDPWGWDGDDDDDENTKTNNRSQPPSLQDLQSLARAIRDELNTAKQMSKSPMLVWESLTPLWLVHGFPQTLRFLNSFQNCLQVWPVRVESLTAPQHAQLEDVSQAMLTLAIGDMTLMRQGIRERGNIVREALPFRILVNERQQQQQSNNNDNNRFSYRLEEQQDELPVIKKEETRQHETSTTSAKAATTAESTTMTSASSSRPKIQLQLEEDDHQQPKEEQPTSATSNRPLIFLQDDDPEFDDMDEEDPDDDLDI